MRAIVLLLLALCSLSAVLAKKDDVTCVVHSDDCGKCVANGCNWCADGYCVSQDSDICEAGKVATECNAKPIVHQQRQVAVACEVLNCDDCGTRTDCFLCKDDTHKLTKCSAASTCVPDSYSVGYEWWVPAIGIKNLNFVNDPSKTCLTPRTPSSTSPILRFLLAVYLYAIDNTFTCEDIPEAYILGSILKYLLAVITNIDASVITPDLSQCTVSRAAGAKRQMSSDLYEASLLAKFSDFNDLTAEGIAATVVDQAPEVFTVDPSGPPITVGPYLPSSGTGQVVTKKKSNNAKLSKGALAGIIIGCIIFGAVLVALILWLIMRKRDAYPQAFRSPAAAYRP